MQPGDRLVCVLIEPLPVGSRFAVWPLHLTIVPWFRVALDTPDLLAGLRCVSSAMRTFTITMDDDARFGRHGRKLVSLVALPSPVAAVEQAVRSFLKSYSAWLVDDSTRVRQPYQPHVTAQGAKRLQRGDTFLCERVYLIERLGDTKTVAGIVELDSE